MRIEIDGTSFEVELYDNAAARGLLESLPQRISMSRWGDEFYGALAGKIDPAG
ncbi:MAG: Cyclophilin-like family, partial [Deltaproteobacteria bacterium]|nr:Cyclophilin-like family [Deltaproteobacteria bacterium]